MILMYGNDIQDIVDDIAASGAFGPMIGDKPMGGSPPVVPEDPDQPSLLAWADLISPPPVNTNPISGEDLLDIRDYLNP